MGKSTPCLYRMPMDISALTVMASAFTFSSLIVLLGWR